MANALAREIAINAGEQPGSLAMLLEVYYAGTDVPGGVSPSQVYVSVPAAAQPAAIRTAMSAAIVSEATAQGFTVAPGDITMPSWQKG